MNEKLFKKFCNTVEMHGMLKPDGCVAVGLSGGADSVCLLLLLRAYSEKRCGGRLAVRALHYHHGIRGEEADADEAFCRSLCDGLGIPFAAERGDVPAFAKESGMSLEEAGRLLRYRALERFAETDQARIAVAHTAGDRAETVLLNIARGSSTDGLRGIPYVRGNIIRPLLDFTRQETERVCREAGVRYRTDSTNADLHYRRNLVRLEVLPYLSRVFGGDFPERLLRLSSLAAEESDYMKSRAQALYSLCARETEDGCCLIDPAMLLSLHPAMGKRVVRMAIASVRKDGETVFTEGTGLDQSATERIYAYIASGSGGGYAEVARGIVCVKWNRSYAVGSEKILAGTVKKARKPQPSGAEKKEEKMEDKRENREGAENASEKKSEDTKVIRTEHGFEKANERILCPRQLLFNTDEYAEAPENHPLQEETVFQDGIAYVTDGRKFLVRAQLFSEEEIMMAQLGCLMGNNGAVLFDFDALCAFALEQGPTADLMIRTAREGDVFRPSRGDGEKPLRRFYTDRKVPPATREILPVIACGSQILHVFYLSKSEIASVQKNTRCGIMIKICGLMP